MESPLNKYITVHSSAARCEALEWIEKQTHIHTNYPQMLSGSVQGGFLKMMVQLMGARNILEIGTFTGYSACCMALGMDGGGHIDALEINDELEDLIREGWSRAGVDSMISLHIGDARETLKTLDGPYDLVFMDANKREYMDYYEAVLPKLRPGGLILADDVLWDGKVCTEPVPQDAQTRALTEFNDAVAADPRVETVVLPLRDGITMIRKK